MYELTIPQQNAIDEQLQGKLKWAESRKLEAEQLALDATRLLSCTSDRLETYQNQGFFMRCWCSLGGKNDEMQRANQRDLISMQQYAWRYINLLNERSILLPHSMITIKNNLMTLAVTEEETRNEVRRMAEKVYERFVALEDRMKAAEVATSIHGWLLTLDTQDYDERYTPHFRLLRIVNDFLKIKNSDWNPQELRYLQKAVKEVDLPWKQPITVEAFVDGVIDEIETAGYGSFEGLLGNKNGSTVPVSFILDNIAVPTYTSLFSIADNYTKSSDTIDVLVDQLSCSRIEAIKKVLLAFITRQGVNVSAQVPLRDLAIELLSCMSLSRSLFYLTENNNSQAKSIATGNATELDTMKYENINIEEIVVNDALKSIEEKKQEKIDNKIDSIKQLNNDKCSYALDNSDEFDIIEDKFDKYIIKFYSPSVINKILSGDVYALLSVCKSESLQPLVGILLGANSNSLNANNNYKTYNPDHIKYYKEIADEFRLFGGHSVSNIFRSEGPSYPEIVVDVCKKLDVPFREGLAFVVENEINLLSAFLPKNIEKITDEAVEDAINRARDKAVTVLNNKARVGVGIATLGLASLLSLPVIALSEAYRITAPCVLYISFLRSKFINNHIDK